MNRKLSRHKSFIALLALSALFLNPALSQAKDESSGTLYQVSTLQALALGINDGPTTFGELLKNGNFGLGTINALDGEVIILDGKAWQARSDGKIILIARDVKTPFALVTRFKTEKGLKATGAEYAGIKQILTKELLTTPNVIYAIKIHGVFSRMKVRSVSRQTRPYPTLAEATKTQTVWEWKNITGTLVGFRFPSYLAGVNLADFHFHFIADDKVHGGHVLDCRLTSGDIETQSLRKFEMILPPSEEFDRADLEQDQKAALEKAEKG